MSVSDRKKSLVKVRVSLPNNLFVKSESLWSESLEHDNYRIDNTPFFAYGLNYNDVVKAVENEEGRLEVVGMVRPGGHATIRVKFIQPESVGGEAYCLGVLKKLGAVGQAGYNTLYALDIANADDYPNIVKQLMKWMEQMILSFEECHQRVPGSFDTITPAEFYAQEDEDDVPPDELH